MRVCAIIVAFDERKQFLNQILEQLQQIGVSETVVVDNSPDQLFARLDKLEQVSVITSKKNLGSSGGFRLGLEKALATSCDFFWLLDEDNYPEREALEALHEQWERLGDAQPGHPFMLLSYRPRLLNHLNPRWQEDQLCILPSANSYLGFHIRQFRLIIRNRILSRPKEKFRLDDKIDPIRIDAAYYGGLFFHRQVIAEGLLPDPSLVLYWDDIDFSLRFQDAGGHIWLVPESQVTDLDRRKIGLRGGLWHHPSLDFTPSFKGYYYIRNLTLFQGRVPITQRAVFTLNRWVLHSLIWSLAVTRGKRYRYRLFRMAIKAGQQRNAS